jgi:hypothetical protein
MEQIYIVRTRMSSPNHTEKSEEVNEMSSLIYYRWNRDTRRRIQATRMRFKGPIYQNTVSFYGLHLCSEEQMAAITDRVAGADAAMKEIHPDLGADVTFIPLDVAEIGRGALYGQIADAIRAQIHDRTFKRLEKVTLDENNALTPRTKASIRKMLDQMAALNILGDQDVAARIAEIRKRIEDDAILPLKGELAAALKKTPGRFHALEI